VAAALLATAVSVIGPPAAAEAGGLEVVPCSSDTVWGSGDGDPAWAAGLPQPVVRSATKTEHYVTAPDGVRLAARVYRPAIEGRVPTVLHLTPYSGAPNTVFNAFSGGTEQTEQVTGRIASCMIAFFVARGYAVVVADLRGTYQSGGCLDFSGPKDQADGRVLVDWIAAQTWSDRTVGMSGFSAPGISQLATAVAAPSALKAIIPTSAVHWYERSHSGGTLRNYGHVDGSVFRVFTSPDSPDVLPWAQARSACGPATAEHVAAVTNPDGTRTAYWRARDLPLHADRIRAAVLYAVGGPADNADGFGRMWTALEEAGVARKGFIGHWPHFYPTIRHWGLYELRWLEHWLRGNDTGVMAEPALTRFDQRGVARTSDQLQPQATTLYVHRDMLAEQPPPRGTASYVAVPGMTRPAVAAADAARLAVQTAPTPSARRISGRPVLLLSAALDGTDTDFAALVHDVAPDGTRRFVSRGYLDARHRTGLDDPPTPVRPGVVQRYTVTLDPAEHTLLPGHRLELLLAANDNCVVEVFTGDVVPPSECPNRNGLVSDGSTATTTVHLGPGATRLQLPLVDG
jgi:putative CocE/NonD family hydrolase